MAGLARLRHEEDGLSAGAESLVFGVLVFVVGTLIVANAWAVMDADLAAGAAAREATRVLVETTAPTWSQAVTQAETAARATLAGHGKDPDASRMRLVDGPDLTVEGTAPPRRCVRITIEIVQEVDAVTLPLLGGWAGAFTATGRHSELMDPLRSGLAGPADTESGCA